MPVRCLLYGRPVEFNIAAQVSHIEANRGIKDALMVGPTARASVSVTDHQPEAAYFRRGIRI